VLGLVLTAIGRASGELRTFERFLDERVKAERLRDALPLPVPHRPLRDAGPSSRPGASRARGEERRRTAVSRRAEEFHRLYATLCTGTQLSFYEASGGEYCTAHRQVVVVRNAMLLAAAVAGPSARSRAEPRGQPGASRRPSSPPSRPR
jgi:hypothetical protein